MVDSKRKERYEVLYEDMMAKMETLTDHVLSLGERMDRSFKEIRKEIAEFKSDVNLQFKLIREEAKTDRQWLIKHDKQLEKHEKLLVNE